MTDITHSQEGASKDVLKRVPTLLLPVTVGPKSMCLEITDLCAFHDSPFNQYHLDLLAKKLAFFMIADNRNPISLSFPLY